MSGTLVFHQLPQTAWFQRLKKGAFGIIEPGLSCPEIDLRRLDLIFMPLVGVDKNMRRLGMGGGFYDRTLAFKQGRPGLKPTLIGVAHQCQKVDTLPTNEWDIPLDDLIIV